MIFLPQTGAGFRMPQSARRHVARVNHLLARLSAETGGYLASVMRSERPAQGLVLSTRSEAATEIWFPNTGVIALSITDDEGRTVQTGMVGSEGCVGLETLYPPTPTLADAAVQVSGEMSVIPAAHLRLALETTPAIQATFFHFLYSLSAQSLQTVACNRLHGLEARCCRWLLMLGDRTGDNDLPLTQESLATMLGGGRPRINGLLALLEQDGLVRRFRGRIRLMSRSGLEARACECYRLLRQIQEEPADA
jgi:CRP-like cAMP-binding protein